MAKAIEIKNGGCSSCWRADHLLLLLLLAVACYWPLSLGLMSVKNDNITAFLPVRYHIVEALRQGQLPLWTPYMYLGYPVHADMQSGAWNPVVWMLSLLGRYDLTSMHAEVMIAIFFAGAGMYRLLGAVGMLPWISMAGAAAYMMCGFVTDTAGSNLLFLWAAACIPFAFAYYYHLLVTPRWVYAAKTAIALCFFLSAAYPSFFILAVYVMLAALLMQLFHYGRHKEKISIRLQLKMQLLTAAIFLLLSSPMLVSYLGLLPFYSRGAGVSQVQAMVNSLHPYNAASLLFPAFPIRFPATAETDLIAKNMYSNLYLLAFMIGSFFVARSRLISFTLAGIVFFFLFSLGHHTPLRAVCYDLLPLMDSFRHPANARLFVIIGIIVAGSFTCNKYYHHQIPSRTLLWITLLLMAAAVTAFIISLTGINSIHQWPGFTGSGWRNDLKAWFDGLNHYDLLLVASSIQLVFFIFFLFVMRGTGFKTRLITTALILNSFIMAQTVLPFTSGSRLSPGVINHIIHQQPSGFPVPSASATIGEQSRDALLYFDTIGIYGFYTKKFVLTDVYYTPTILERIDALNRDTALSAFVLNQPYAYLGRGQRDGMDHQQIIMPPATIGTFSLVAMNNNNFRFATHSKDSMWFCLQQVHLPGWQCRLDGKTADIHTVNGTFMGVYLPQGRHELEFIYRPWQVLVALVLSVLCGIALIFLFLKRRRKAHV